ncbi:hypothetical protein ACQPXT_34635 [Streptomyces sp. CA-100214]
MTETHTARSVEERHLPSPSSTQPASTSSRPGLEDFPDTNDRSKDYLIPSRDPDFDLYDNAGRDADQIHAARYNLATRGDLKRWARRDAARFRTAHPLPDPSWQAPDLTPYLDALAAAQTPAEMDAVTDHVLDAAEPALRALSDYLVAAARWKQENRNAAKGSPSYLLMTAASGGLPQARRPLPRRPAPRRAGSSPTRPTPGVPLTRPPHESAAAWAEARRRQTEHHDLMAQLADRDAEMEHDFSVACGDCELDSQQVPETDFTRRPAPRHRPASRRRSRGR